MNSYEILWILRSSIDSNTVVYIAVTFVLATVKINKSASSLLNPLMDWCDPAHCCSLKFNR
jgi:tryptophan-rich sensory protein